MIRSFLWRNGGFSQFRGKKELEGFEYRYDPTVVPVQNQDNTPAQDYTNLDNFRISSSRQTGGYYSVLDFHTAYKSGKVTPTAVVEALLPIIRRDVDTATQHATAFAQVHADRVKGAAEASAQRYREGKSLGVLDGVPVAVKDQIDVQGYPTYCGKVDIHCGTSNYTSWCISKWEEQGAIVVGKTNMHELGKGTCCRRDGALIQLAKTQERLSDIPQVLQATTRIPTTVPLSTRITLTTIPGALRGEAHTP